MKLAIIHSPPSARIAARMTVWFTGSTAYHCGFVDESDGTFFDMNLLPRKVVWPRYNPPTWIHLYDVPKLTRQDCEDFLKRDGTVRYGVMDYILFGLRPVYHLLGKSTRNAGGMICSEMCAVWLNRVGYFPPMEPVPSPGVLERWAFQTLIADKE